MKRPAIYGWLVFTFALVILALLLLPKSLFHSTRQEKQESLEVTLTEVIGTGEWVLAKGYYSAVIFEPDEENQKAEIYVEGAVRMGLALKDIEIRRDGQNLEIYYPEPRLLGVDLAQNMYLSDGFDQELYNQALSSAKFRLFSEALKEGIARQAEDNLLKQISLLARSISPGAGIRLEKKPAAGGKQ